MNTRTKQPIHALRVTTWNVLNKGYENPEYYAKESHAYLHWDQGRRERATEYLRHLTYDVTCLQEVSQEMLCQLMGETRAYTESYVWAWEPRTESGAKTEDGLAIVYQTQCVTLVKKFVWRYPSGKHIFLACLFDRNDCEPKSRFWCVNTHVNWSTRESDLLELQRQLNEHPEFIASPAPKIIVGDFNAERSEEWYTVLSKNGLFDALMTYTHYPYSYNSGKSAKWIDFVLLHGIGQETRIVKVIVGHDSTKPYAFQDDSLPNVVVPSDHLPVTVLLRDI